MKVRTNPTTFPGSLWKGVTLAKAVKWSGTHLLLAGLIFFASWLRFPNFLFGCVDYLEHAYFDLAGHSISSQVHPDLRLIYIEEKEKNDPWYFGDEESRRRWRVYHAKLLESLTKAGARIVAFDFAFPESSPFDNELAVAIRNAGKTRVIIGYIPEPGRLEPEVSDKLKPALGSGQLASIRVGIQKKGSPYYGYVLLARSRPMAVGQTVEAAPPSRSN
jgi:CHASE2 domain-containing sensor protein